MARIHTDVHVIPPHLVEPAIKCLIEHGFITRSVKDIRYSDIRSFKSNCPDTSGFLEISVVY